MTPREKFMMALEGKQPPGLVPHFELVFFLTMEAFGKVHPSHRNYFQWDQMQAGERQLHRDDMAGLYIATAERYQHSAIYLHPNPNTLEESIRLLETVRDRSGDEYCLLLPGDATFGIPSGSNMVDFACRMSDDPRGLSAEAEEAVNTQLDSAEQLRDRGGLDGFALCSDYCFNTGPFMSPAQFGQFVAPHLTRLIAGYRDMGFYTIKHTDGNIMPILDQLVQANPHALHSIDPQGGVDIAEVKRLVGKKVCLIGNVCCATMQTGSTDDVERSASYALKHGMPGGGYVFSTSNCIYTGMPLERYELMLDVWRREGNYERPGGA